MTDHTGPGGFDAGRSVENLSVLSRALGRAQGPREATESAVRALHDGLRARETWAVVLRPDGQRYRVDASCPDPGATGGEVELTGAPALHALRAGHALWDRLPEEMAPVYGPYLRSTTSAATRVSAFPVLCDGHLKALLLSTFPDRLVRASVMGERYGTIVADLLSLVFVRLGEPVSGGPAEVLEHATAVETLGAVAHELNQPLTSILGYLELLERRVDRDAPGGSYVEPLTREVERLASLVERLTRVVRYRTKPYLGQTEILDLDASTPPEGI